MHLRTFYHCALQKTTVVKKKKQIKSKTLDYSWTCHVQHSSFSQSFQCLLMPVWVFLRQNSPSDQRLSKHRDSGLLIFIIRTSCRQLFSSMGWDFVTSWKKAEMAFVYENGGATAGGGWGTLFVPHPPWPWPLGLRWWYHHSNIRHKLRVSKPETVWWLQRHRFCRNTFVGKWCKTGHVERPAAY